MDLLDPARRQAGLRQRSCWRCVWRTEPKSARSRRVVPLPASVGQALRLHQRRQVRERRWSRREWEDNDLVFATAHRMPLDGTNVMHGF